MWYTNCRWLRNQISVEQLIYLLITSSWPFPILSKNRNWLFQSVGLYLNINTDNLNTQTYIPFVWSENIDGVSGLKYFVPSNPLVQVPNTMMCFDINIQEDRERNRYRPYRHVITWSGLQCHCTTDRWFNAMDSRTNCGDWWEFPQSVWWWKDEEHYVQSSLERIWYKGWCVMICFHTTHNSSKFLICSPLNKVCHFSKCVSNRSWEVDCWPSVWCRNKRSTGSR